MFSATPHTLALDVLDAAPPGGIRRRDLDGDAVLVVFDHLCLHEGVEVSSGVKYAVRTDVIFR